MDNNLIKSLKVQKKLIYLQYQNYELKMKTLDCYKIFYQPHQCQTSLEPIMNTIKNINRLVNNFSIPN